MKHAKTRSSKSRSKKPDIADTSRSPNRTVDDSPGTEDLARRTDIRDPLWAPGPTARVCTAQESSRLG